MTQATYMKINVTDVPTKTLIEVFNACQELLGGRPVQKFEDRAKAEQRTRFVLSQIRPEKRPEPFREGNGEVDEPAPQVTIQTVDEDDGEEPIVSATQDAERPVAPQSDESTTKVDGASDLDFGNRTTKRRKALVDKLVSNRNKFVPLSDLVKAVYGKDADVAAMKGALLMSMKGIYRLIDDNDLPVKLEKRKDGKDIAYGLVDKA